MKTTDMNFYSIPASKLDLLPVQDGNLIFVRDTRKIYVDAQNKRVEYSSIITLINEEHREKLQALVGFYYVRETNALWHYDGESWIALNAQQEVPVEFANNTEEIPDEGKENTLYVTMNGLYRWNGTNYTDLTSNVWGNIDQ